MPALEHGFILFSCNGGITADKHRLVGLHHTSNLGVTFECLKGLYLSNLHVPDFIFSKKLAAAKLQTFEGVALGGGAVGMSQKDETYDGNENKGQNRERSHAKFHFLRQSTFTHVGRGSTFY